MQYNNSVKNYGGVFSSLRHRKDLFFLKEKLQDEEIKILAKYITDEYKEIKNRFDEMEKVLEKKTNQILFENENAHTKVGEILRFLNSENIIIAQEYLLKPDDRFRDYNAGLCFVVKEIKKIIN
jgi:uncharacterized membrane protein